MAAAGHGVAKHAVHHAALDGKVDDGFLLTVIDAGEFGLFALFLYHLHLLHQLGRDVLGGQLGIVQEEGFAGDGDLGDGFPVGSDGAILGHFNARELLQEIHQHVVVADLERRSVILYGIFLDDDGVARCRYRGCVQDFAVQGHLDNTQIQVFLEFNCLLIGLVTHDFGLERIFAAAHFFQYGIAVTITEGVLWLTFFAG